MWKTLLVTVRGNGFISRSFALGGEMGVVSEICPSFPRFENSDG